MTRLLVAHADAVLEDANKVIIAMEPLLSGWDFEEPVRGRELFHQLRDLMPGSPQISSAWVLDAKGVNRLDSVTYPAKPVDGSGRQYFKTHMAGAAEPVLLGDNSPGLITGEERFTFSRTLQNPDGTLRGVIVVANYARYFEKLYAEVANWDRARAGLFVDGVPMEFSALARLRTVERASPTYIAAVDAARKRSAQGSTLIQDGSDVRVASWDSSEKYKQLYAVVSQPFEGALAEWRKRSLVLGVASLALIAGFFGLAILGARATEARAAVLINEMLAREVHHRVKNSLQIVAGLLSMRAAHAANTEVKTALLDGVGQINAIANVHEVMQVSVQLGLIDFEAVIKELCVNLEKSANRKVTYSGCGKLMMEPSQVSSLAIVANELITNAIRHSRETVTVTVERVSADVLLTVRDDGPGLPPNFDPRETGRFGLVTTTRLCNHLGGNLSWDSSPSGTLFRARVPQRMT
ncbi:MAG: sensor histidine kinase [Beijerinckiaceae bacterium]|nr:sensor histidine kinase [Beijerinckiaceae bacterium]